jgi:formylglycine-generating enzyme required for sulfatase activity
LDEPCRLPTESEWEYAARGVHGPEYPFGDEFDPSRCNTVESGIGHTTPVDRYGNGVSDWGIFDLPGNVEEWTSDLYAPYPGGEFVHDDLSEQTGGTYPVLRGGSFARGGDLARCARRHGPLPAASGRYRGFRVAVSDAAPLGSMAP